VHVKVLFFASLVDIVGSRKLEFDIGDGVTVEQLLDRLETMYPGLTPYASILHTAINEEYAKASDRLKDGDEVALFPPVSGGESVPEPLTEIRDKEHYEITYQPIDSAKISRRLLRDEDGAICVFEGVVRNQSRGKTTRYLVYEAYEGMALKKMEAIGRRVREMWEVDSVAILHRLGRLEIGETSVAVVVTSPHRRAAFDACHYAIDLLKKVVPIWKKEHFEDGEVWVEGQHE
jgi:molybdopterin converting factor subunit 1